MAHGQQAFLCPRGPTAMPEYEGQCWDSHEPSWKVDTLRHHSEPYVWEGATRSSVPATFVRTSTRPPRNESESVQHSALKHAALWLQRRSIILTLRSRVKAERRAPRNRGYLAWNMSALTSSTLRTPRPLVLTGAEELRRESASEHGVWGTNEGIPSKFLVTI